MLVVAGHDTNGSARCRSVQIGLSHRALQRNAHVRNSCYAHGGETNPFRYGALALDDAFTNRETEVAELLSDVLNGQDVVVFAPRRYGKSSLVWRVSERAIAQDVLVAHVNLMTTPTSERLAEKLAETIHDDLASTLFRARERLRVFSGLRITPIVTVDPTTGKLGFSFDAGRQPQDLDATLERLLELPGQLAAERGRKVALVLDEFQEIVDIDPELPKIMRSVFETQPEVAHVYLGSKRHMLERIFNDENEPFWRSAKQMEIGVIAPELFRGYIDAQFERTGRRVEPEVVDRVLESTLGHPYATQELCYFVWEETPEGATRRSRAVRDRPREAPPRRACALRPRLGEGGACAAAGAARARARSTGARWRATTAVGTGFPGPSSVQRALDALRKDELVARDATRRVPHRRAVPRGVARRARPLSALASPGCTAIAGNAGASHG